MLCCLARIQPMCEKHKVRYQFGVRLLQSLQRHNMKHVRVCPSTTINLSHCVVWLPGRSFGLQGIQHLMNKHQLTLAADEKKQTSSADGSVCADDIGDNCMATNLEKHR